MIEILRRAIESLYPPTEPAPEPPPERFDILLGRVRHLLGGSFKNGDPVAASRFPRNCFVGRVRVQDDGGGGLLVHGGDGVVRVADEEEAADRVIEILTPMVWKLPKRGPLHEFWEACTVVLSVLLLIFAAFFWVFLR